MEPVGVSRKLAFMPAGHGNGGAGTLRLATSIRKNLEFRHAETDARADDKKKSQMWENSHFRSLGSGRIGRVKRYQRYIEGGLNR